MDFKTLSINDRVYYLRKNEFSMTLEEFGQRIQMTKGAVSYMEKGNRVVSERTIKIICSEFNVNEKWLRTGEGEMFIENDDTILADLSKQYNLSNADEALFRAFLKCSPEERVALKQLAFKLMDEVNVNEELLAEYQRTKSEYQIENLPLAAAVDVFDEKELTYEQRKQILLDEFEAAEKRRMSSAFTDTSGANTKIG